MLKKLQVLPIKNAKECPFYVLDANDKYRCFIKHVVSAPIAMSVVDDNPDFDQDTWLNNCGGKWESCSVLPLLYKFNTEDAQSEEVVGIADTSVLQYDPFSEDDEEQAFTEGHEEDSDENIPVIDNSLDKSVDSTTPAQESTPENDTVKVTLHKFEDPYRVKADIVVYPTRRDLLISDSRLLTRAGYAIQSECDAYRPPVQLGQVYPTSNGGVNSRVSAKKIYHAVVTGPGLLSNAEVIRSAILRSLFMAEIEKAETIVMMPCDCGTFDLSEAAMAQFSAIDQFIKNNDSSSVKRIYIVIEDDETLQLFEGYHRRILKNI